MKLVRKVVVLSIFSLIGAVCWAGCTDDENPTSAKDAGGGGGGNKDVVQDDVQTLDANLLDTGRPVQVTPQDYCALMQANCAGQYPSNQACLAAAARFQIGTVGDTLNTLACRIGAALKSDCKAASASGGGVCGSRCEAFCRLAANDQPLGFCRQLIVDAGTDVLDTGTGADGATDADPDAEGGTAAEGGGGTDGGVGTDGGGPIYTEPYPSLAACTAQCPSFAVDTNNESFGTATSTNNYNCRMYHLLTGLGLGQAGKVHCNHIGVTSPTCNQ
jgi:hypothetical protein